MELRQALEPWHVLGEEGTAGGTARYVDNSLDRVQVLVRDGANGRFAVTCNRRGLPLTNTGTFGEKVAGVRYRSWQPASALHPNIPPHVPLVFDIMDTWTGRSVGGCRYHAAHPGGRNIDLAPVNAYEAEGRRLARFEKLGHTPGRETTTPAAVNPEYPADARPAALTGRGRHGHRTIYSSLPGLAAAGATQREALSSRRHPTAKPADKAQFAGHRRMTLQP